MVGLVLVLVLAGWFGAFGVLIWRCGGPLEAATGLGSGSFNLPGKYCDSGQNWRSKFEILIAFLGKILLLGSGPEGDDVL